MRIKLLLATAVVAGVFSSSVGFAPVAQARVRCSYSGPPGNLLTVRTGASDTAYIRRDGAEIAVVFFNLTLDKERARCSGGTPTVFNTEDLLLGGRGNDHIHSRDKSRDRIRCGPGRDKARADRRDRVRGCEVTRRR